MKNGPFAKKPFSCQKKALNTSNCFPVLDETEPVTGWTNADNDYSFLTVQNASQKQNVFPQQTFSAIFKNGSRKAFQC